jgi:hypothetical protein
MAVKDIYYKGNPNLRSNTSTFSYSEEQLKEIVKCSKDKIYFIKNYIYIVNLKKGLMKFNTYDFQDELLDITDKNDRVIVKFPRQSGKSTTIAADILHYILFNANKTAAILANKESIAREILSRIKKMYENLPLWLQHGIVEWNKGSIVLSNGSKIVASSTSSTAVRGMSINYLLCDELAFIEKNVFEEFWTSVYPTISSSDDSRVVVVSTPNGMNAFYKMWTEAVRGTNGFTPFCIEWWQVPGRDEKWKAKTLAEIGEEKFKQEFSTEFLGSAGTLINGDTLRNMVHDEPEEVVMDSKFRIYQLPKENSKYLCIVDVAEGLGESFDFSTIQIFCVDEKPYKQVAVYEDNEIKTNEFPTIIKIIAEKYNEALVIVESNSIGDGVLNDLVYDEEYENVFFATDVDAKDTFGIKMTKGSKNAGCSHLKNNIENGLFEIVDFNTINQFSTFIKHGQSYEADDGYHDDLITPLIHLSYFFSRKNWVEDWLDSDFIRNDNKLSKMEEELMPLGFYNDGNESFSMDDDLEIM